MDNALAEVSCPWAFPGSEVAVARSLCLAESPLSRDACNIQMVKFVKMELRALCTSISLSAFLLIGQAYAGSFEDGFNAYIQQDYSTSRKILAQRADGGDTVAAYYMGMIYHFGLGTPQDRDKAVRWYKIAASKGLANAQYNLGLVSCPGVLCTQEVASEAAFWYQRAAKQGYAEAQYRLGLLYGRGLGVPKDDVEASVWLSLAAARGCPEAGLAQEAITARLKPEHLREVQERVQRWGPTQE